MHRDCYSAALAAALLSASANLAFAAPGHDGHDTAAGKTAQAEGSGHANHGGHAHSSWPEPPAEFANKVWRGWDDPLAAARGKQVYQRNCAYCHGDTGKGDGVMAPRLAHGPADLTNNFHTAPGKGDGYLYWRVTEGARVEPFRSQNSSMPAFETSLSERQRWEVLTYVHQAFHGGFPAHQGHHDKAEQTPAGHHDHSRHAH